MTTHTVRVYLEGGTLRKFFCVGPENWFTGELDDETRISELVEA